MTISTKGEYALRALLELGLLEGKSASLREIAHRWALPEHYMEHLMATLRKSGFVRSRRGSRGGYSLARPMAEITVREVLEVLEGPVEPFYCIAEPGNCRFSPACSIRDLMFRVKHAVEEVLETTTLADLCRNQKAKQAGSRGAVFHI